MMLIPQAPLEINWDHPLSRGLLEFGYTLDGATKYSALRKVQPFSSGTATPSASAHGRAININASPNYINLGRNISASAAVASGFVQTRVNSLTNAAILLTSASQSGANYIGHWFGCATTGALDAHYGDGAGAGVANRRSAASATGIIAAGETFSAGFVCRAAADWSLYKNGVSLAPTYSGTASAYAAGTTRGTINFRSVGTVYGDQASSLWAFWNRALTNAEMWLLAQNPAVLLRRTAKILYFKAPVAGGGGLLTHPGMTGGMRDMVGGMRG